MADSIQVNTSLDPETAMQLDKLAQDMGYDNRSAYVRWLIRQEWARRKVFLPKQSNEITETLSERG